MALQVIHKAWISCSQGTCPTQIQIKPVGMGDVKAEAVAAANVSVKVPTDGVMKRFNAAGQLVAQSTYANGKLHGESLVFNAAGQVSQKLMFANGKLHGGATLHGEGGSEIHLPFHEGKLEGKANFMISGKKAAELAYKAGVRTGVSVMYNAEGQLASKTHFVNNVRHGLHVMYHAGAVAKAEIYANGALQAKGHLEARLESGVEMAGEAAFEAGLKAAGEVGAVAAVSAHAEVEAEFHASAKMKMAAAAAIQDASQMAALAAATLSIGATLAAGSGVNGGMYADSKPSATIMDFIPIKNIVPFCLCMSPSNPLVAAATAAALGVLTPMPCIPATTSPWIPGAAGVMINNNIALDNTCQLMCAFGGVINVVEPGQTVLTIP